jgi:C-5 cytosine-specific DNA methylase
MPRISRKKLDAMGQSTFLLPALPAKTLALPDAERVWLERAATCRSGLLNLFMHFGPQGCCSRTSLASLAPFRTLRRIKVHRQTIYEKASDGSLKTTTKLTKEVISDSFWPRFQTSGIQTSVGQCWTLSTSAWRNGASVCSLSQVLESGPIPSQYYLTPKACQGILRRAEKRGKELPEALARALRAVADSEQTLTSGGGLIEVSPSARPVSPQSRCGDLHPRTECLYQRGGQRRIDGESETFIADRAPALDASFGRLQGQDDQHINAGAGMFVAHDLRAEGFDASEDGTGRGIPSVADPLRIHPRPASANPGAVIPILEAGARTGASTDDPRAGIGIGADGDPMFSLQSGKQHAIAFSSKDHGADASELAPTLRSMGHDGSHANWGGQVAVAFDTTQATSAANRSNPKEGDPCHPLASGAHAPAVAFQEAQTGVREYAEAGSLRANGPGHDPVGTRVREGMAVRRLTPRECERLQGFTDDYTLVQHRGKLAADGPRYKALGNSMAVPCISWILSRMREVDSILAPSDRTHSSAPG